MTRIDLSDRVAPGWVHTDMAAEALARDGEIVNVNGGSVLCR